MTENEVFCTGVAAGINLYQQKIVRSAERKEPVKIGDDLYYVQNGKDRLQEMIDVICK